jgi:protein kinase-like protein
MESRTTALMISEAEAPNAVRTRGSRAWDPNAAAAAGPPPRGLCAVGWPLGWQERLPVLCNAALRRDPEEREAFLDDACSGDARLRAFVAALLDARGRTAEIRTSSFEAGRALAEPAVPLRDGCMVGPYIIRHEIGRGAMGVVYLAEDTRLSRRVALKALVPDLGRDASRRERLRQEARAAAGLSHQGIATVYALEEIGPELYLAYEYVAGHTLRDMLKSDKLPLTQVVGIALQLAKALASAHAHGVVHRDLKPENVITTSSGVVKILDFGIACVEDRTSPHLTEIGTILGTPAYMAPEQARGQGVDFRTDLFSFGVLVYEMASGSNPFDAGTVTATIARILELDPEPLSAVCQLPSPHLDRIVARCLRKHPFERYESTQELVDDLERLAAGLSADGRHASGIHRRQPGPPTAGTALGRHVAAAARETHALTPWQWWEFHQLVISAVYGTMMYPAWRVQAWLSEPWGIVLLFAVSSCAAVATTLRLHLWFTARFNAVDLLVQRARTVPWIRSCDIGFAISQVLAAVAIANAHPEVAMLQLSVSLSVAIASCVIEPATTTVAFRAELAREVVGPA